MRIRFDCATLFDGLADEARRGIVRWSPTAASPRSPIAPPPP